MSLSELSLAKTSKEAKKILSITKSKLEAGIVSQLELIEDERQFLETNRKAVVSTLQVFQFALDLRKHLDYSGKNKVLNYRNLREKNSPFSGI